MNLDQHWDGNVSHKRFINLPGVGDYLPIVVGMYLTRAWHHLILQDGKTKTCLSYIIYVLFILNPCLSIYHDLFIKCTNQTWKDRKSARSLNPAQLPSPQIAAKAASVPWTRLTCCRCEAKPPPRRWLPQQMQRSSVSAAKAWPPPATSRALGGVFPTYKE